MQIQNSSTGTYLTSTLISSPSKADIGVSQFIGVLSLSGERKKIIVLF